jgi:hypothetical protein
MKMPTIPVKIMVIAGIAGALLLSAVPSFYFYGQYRQLQKKLKDPTAVTKEDAKKLIDQIGMLMELPAGEEPGVATVTDKEKLSGQPFFIKAQNGDRLLIYTQARRAILFRPSTNKIIDIAPINLGDATATASATSSATGSLRNTLKVVLLNGTSIVGITKKIEDEFTRNNLNIEVVDKSNAKKKTYEQSVLVDLTGTKETQAKELAKQIGVSYGTLPEDETKPTGADFLILVGADKK